MAILERPRLLAQQRYDLEDFNSLLSSLRSDSLYWTKRFQSSENYILKGFTTSGVGLKSATINMSGATLLFSENTSDFSWFTAEDGASNLTIAEADLINGLRNYIELHLYTENNTPVTKAFWDDTANAGNGAEFNQQINTVTTIRVATTVLAGGFSGSPDRIPLAIIDTDVTGTIKVIIDKRNLYFRLGTAIDPNNTFSWVTREEPAVSIILSGGAGTYIAGETVTFSSGATGIVNTGGTTNITIRELSNDSYASGDTLVGSISGASRTVDTILHSFTGADLDISDQKEMNNALMTEIKLLKGTSYWYQNPLTSLIGMGRFVNSVLAPNSSNARFSWSGTELSITDDNGTPLNSDIIGYLRIFGYSQDLELTRQDAASSTITIADQEVLYVEVPSSGNVTYSDVGVSSTNYKLVNKDNFVVNDTNFWIAYREGSNLILKGMGELEAGEDRQISDNTTLEVLSFIGAAGETDTTPPYPFTPNGLCPQAFTSSDSLTAAIGRTAENVNELYNTIPNILSFIGSTGNTDTTPPYPFVPNTLCPQLFTSADDLTVAIGRTAENVNGLYNHLDIPSYDEILTVVSGAPVDDNEITGPVVSGTTITLPLNSRSTPINQIQNYIVGKGNLEVFLNGQYLSLGTNGWSEVGVPSANSNQIIINQDLFIDDVLEFRITSSGGPTPDDNFNTLPEASTADNTDYIPIWDSSASGYRKINRANFIVGISNLLQVNTYSANHNASVSADDVLVVNAVAGNVTIMLPAAASANGKKFNIKKIDASGFSVIINGNGALIDGNISISTTTQYESFTVVCDGVQWYII